HHLGDVVGSTRLRAASNRRTLPTAERLALHDCAGDAAIDVRVAHVYPIEPPIDFVVVERMNPTGQSERSCVLHLDRLVEIGGAHDTENGPEALRDVEP